MMVFENARSERNVLCRFIQPSCYFVFFVVQIISYCPSKEYFHHKGHGKPGEEIMKSPGVTTIRNAPGTIHVYTTYEHHNRLAGHPSSRILHPVSFIMLFLAQLPAVCSNI